MPSWKTEQYQTIRLLNPFLLSVLALVFGAVLLIQFVGFYPTILITLPACLFLFGERSFWKMGLFTVITTGVIYLVLDVILGSNLP